ncbi:group II intron reverse transcriptase/maturase [Microseira sp. BLCC-F43]|jgi:RNA-directed DNA polymerase|uniref:group II intron reverse transcriptase/maturase n=1 Tax=Microseira sp. BLCC-F43 TaxID=3153602 RepID=UPI0035B9F5BB
MNKSNTEAKTTVEWKELPGRKLERTTFKLQKRIYQASGRGDHRTVKRLQKTLMKSKSAKCLAVRKVSQENQGKKTAGVDGCKQLNPAQRLALVKILKLSGKASPTRRVWIPKPGKKEMRPLGIPTIDDRGLQAIVKMALEPEWEALFEPNSFGFRPGRSCHDAIEAIYGAIKQKPKYVLDADIAQCFDKINHDALLKKLNTTPSIRRQIKSCLKANVMDGETFFPTQEGTPQGNVVSPLLANIALHGLEEHLMQYAETLDDKNIYRRQQSWKSKRMALSVIRYADDFVVLHKELRVIQECQQLVSDWLKGMGLELKPEKTNVSHTLYKKDGKHGFSFLGFAIQQYEVGKHASKQGFKTIITPDKEKLKSHIKEVGKLIHKHQGSSRDALIATLNPIIRGWANYYKTVCSKDIFQTADHQVYQQIRGWGIYRHEKMESVWHSKPGMSWTFATKDGQHWQALHSDTKITRHIKVKGNRSPYDGDWVYWSTRRVIYSQTPTQVAKLLKEQGGQCSHCGNYFSTESLLEVDRIDQNRNNNKPSNLRAVHRHCHDEIHAMRDSKAWDVNSNDYQPIP